MFFFRFTSFRIVNVRCICGCAIGWRGKEKVVRLEFVENSVGRVGSVGTDEGSTNATNATNARIESEDRPDTTPANATSASSGHPDDGRERFTL